LIDEHVSDAAWRDLLHRAKFSARRQGARFSGGIPGDIGLFLVWGV
jgi:hypothetical protein